MKFKELVSETCTVLVIFSLEIQYQVTKCFFNIRFKLLVVPFYVRKTHICTTTSGTDKRI